MVCDPSCRYSSKLCSVVCFRSSVFQILHIWQRSKTPRRVFLQVWTNEIQTSSVLLVLISQLQIHSFVHRSNVPRYHVWVRVALCPERLLGVCIARPPKKHSQKHTKNTRHQRGDAAREEMRTTPKNWLGASRSIISRVEKEGARTSFFFFPRKKTDGDSSHKESKTISSHTTSSFRTRETSRLAVRGRGGREREETVCACFSLH